MTAFHVRLLLLIIAIGAVLALYFAPTSYATPEQDSQYLYLVDQEGMIYGSADVAIAQGRAICSDMDQFGYSAGQIVYRAMNLYELPYDSAVAITAISILVYCPWNDPRPMQYA